MLKTDADLTKPEAFPDRIGQEVKVVQIHIRRCNRKEDGFGRSEYLRVHGQRMTF
jgi:hypothetical protein